MDHLRSKWLILPVLLVVGITIFITRTHSLPPPKAGIDALYPVRITIPSIHVDAHIEIVGLTPQGAVDVPKDPANAAWFNQSVRPGQVGNSVIDGHYGLKNNGKAVFDNLSTMHIGEEITVQDSTGISTHFIVREIRTISANEVVPDIFIAKDGGAHLNLITCEGVWNKEAHSYAKRLVVFADKK